MESLLSTLAVISHSQFFNATSLMAQSKMVSCTAFKLYISTIDHKSSPLSLPDREVEGFLSPSSPQSP
ncbi:hypothetical protein [Microcoleus sp.]|uniref:hypothetical protein n=1 Tax=Microcoleus sp. TaxID=44472 RepID=UPI0035936E7D